MNTALLYKTKKHVIGKVTILLALLICGVGEIWAQGEEWSIDFSNITGEANKTTATVSAEVSDGLGTVTIGSTALNTNFGVQTGTSWLYYTDGRLYQFNSGGRNFGVFNAKAKQLITLNSSVAPTPTNATLKSEEGNVRIYEVTTDGTVKFNIARYGNIYSIAVANPTTSNYYTVKYVDGSSNELKDVTTSSGTAGDAISLGTLEKSSFTKDGQKYIYVSDDSDGKTIAEDNSTVVTITFRVAASYNYTVNQVVDGNTTELVSGSTFEGDAVTVYYPEYALSGSTLYGIANNTTGAYWGRTFTPTADNHIETIEYTSSTVDHVAFYTEAESIDGVTTSTNADRASNSQMAYTGTDTYVKMTHLDAGHYTIYWRGVNGNSATRNGSIKFGDEVVYSFSIANGTNVTGNSDVLTVPSGGADVYVSCEGSSASGLDWIYFVGSAPQITFADTDPSEVLAKGGQKFTVDADGTMIIDGGESQTCKAGQQYYAKSTVEVWNSLSDHQTFKTGYDLDKPWAVWCYQDGYEDGGIKPDGTQVNAILNGLREQYSVLMVHGARTQKVKDLCPNITKAALVVIGEMMTGGGANVYLAYSFNDSTDRVIDSTNVLNFKLYQYPKRAYRWGWGTNIDKITQSQISATPKNQMLQIFDGVEFNADGTIDLWTKDYANLDHLHAVREPWLVGAPEGLRKENGTDDSGNTVYTYNPDNTLLTAVASTTGKTESVLHFYKNATTNKVYVGFGMSINDYAHYSDNVTTIVSNIGKMIKAGIPLNAGIESIDAPVVTDNNDGSAKITCDVKSATVYYSTTNTTATTIIAEGQTTVDGVTKKFSVDGTTTVYAVAKYNSIISSVGQGTVASNKARTITRTIASDDTAVGDSTTLSYTAGQTITVPYNQTYMKSGYTVKQWKDRSTGTLYTPGASLTVDQDLVLEAVWAANTHKITDLKTESEANRTATFEFLNKNGAAKMSITTGTAVFVGQVHFSDGDFMDIACQLKAGLSATCPTDKNTYTGKFDNTLTNSVNWSTGDQEEYAQIKTGTVFSFPAVRGMKVRYKGIDLDGDGTNVIHRTYVSFSNLKGATLDNAAFTTTQAASLPVSGAFLDNYSTGGIFSYDGTDDDAANDTIAEFTSIESAVTYAGTTGQTKEEVLSSGTLGWNNGSGFFESLSVTYPALYTISADIQNMTGDISNEEAAKMTVTGTPKNTAGKFPADMAITVNIVPTYPYCFYYMDGLSDEEQAKVEYNYTRVEENPSGEYNYVDLVDSTKTINYGGSYNLIVKGDQTIYAYVKRLTTYTIDVDCDPFRKGEITMPDGRTEYAENNIITVTAAPKVGYLFEKWVDDDGADLVAEGNIKMVDNENAKLSILVTEASAAKSYVAKFKVAGTVEGTLTNDLRTVSEGGIVPDGTETEGFPTSETNTTIAIPKYYTLYKDGYTLNSWMIVYPEALKGTKFPVGYNVSFSSVTAVTAQPVITENSANFKYRTTEADITWDFCTAHSAQVMSFGTNKSFKYSTHATINQSEDGTGGVTLDVPLAITTGTNGCVNNTTIDDWCTIGEGTKIVIPSGLGAKFTLASRAPITSTNIDGNVLTSYTTETQNGVEVYLYTYTTTSPATSVTLTIGDDYSYYKYIRAQLPSADKVTVNLSTNDDAMGTVDMTAAKVSSTAGAADATKTKVDGGYQVALGNYVTVSAYRNNLYEFDHWEVDDAAVEDGDTYAIVKNAVTTDVSAVNATISFYVTSYSTDVKAVFKARPTYDITFTTGTATLGIAPDIVVVEQGGSFTMPAKNQTLYADGQTLKRWKDASGNTYDWGQIYTPAADLTLTPVFEPDEYTLLDIAEGETAVATWNLTKNGGACNLNYDDNSGVYVCQMTYGGKTIDAPLQIASPSANAEISNQDNDAYCVIKKNVRMTVPTSEGCKIALATYSEAQTRLTTTSIAGATSSSDGTAAKKYTSDFTATVTYTGDAGTQEILFAGDVQTFVSVTVTYSHVTMDKPTLKSVKYGSTALDDASLATLNTNKTVTGVEVSPNANDALETVTAECSVAETVAKLTITQPTISNPVATIAMRTAGGVLIATYKIEYDVQVPSADGLVLEKIVVDGHEATRKVYTNENGKEYVVFEVDESIKVNPTGVAAMYYNRQMKAKTVEGWDVASLHGGSPYPGTDDGIHGAFYDAISVEGGKPANMLYWSLEQGKIYDFTLNPGIFSDVYGNAYNDSVHVKFSTMSTSIEVAKKKVNFVVTEKYSSDYVHKDGGALPGTQTVVGDDVINRLDEAGIAHGTIDQAIAAANAATGTDRFYIFVPDGEYQLTGNQTISSINSSDNKDNVASSQTNFKNGMTAITRANVSLIGQSQTGTVLWNNPYFAGSDNNATIDLKTGNDYYLQDLTIDNRFDKENALVGSDSKSYAVALYDRCLRTIMKNVTVQAYEGTYISEATSTSDKNQRAYYETCTFAGTIGFIGGDGNNWWEKCKLLLRKRQSMNYAITSPKHTTTNAWGYVFNGCTIDADVRTSADKKYTLGQAIANSPAVAYLNTQMNVQPMDAGWKQANSAASSMVLRMQEYNSTNINGSVIDIASLRNYSLCNAALGSLDPVMSASKAATYTKRTVLSGGQAYDPTLYTAQRDSVDDLEFEDQTLSWAEDPEALCYFIFRSTSKNGTFELFAITEENTYDIDTEGWYLVRAANQRGGLGLATNPVEYGNTQKYSLIMAKALYQDDDDKDVAWSTVCLPWNAKAPTTDEDDSEKTITVYAAKSISGNTVTLQQVHYLTKGMGYVVYGNPGTYVFKSSSHTSEEKDGVTTHLSGNPSLTTAISATGYNCYTLAYKPNISGIGFYKFSGKTLACNRAWLDADVFINLNESSEDEETVKSSAAKYGIKFVFDDEPDDITGIQDVTVTRRHIDSDAIYDLNGIRVQTPVKGRIYIVNGKKMLFSGDK